MASQIDKEIELDSLLNKEIQDMSAFESEDPRQQQEMMVRARAEEELQQTESITGSNAKSTIGQLEGKIFVDHLV